MLHPQLAETARNSSKPLSAVQKRHRISAATGYLMLGMTAAAERELDSLGADESLDAIRLRGELYRETERHDDALKLYDKLLGIEPTAIDGAIGKAWCLKRLSRLDEAIQTLRIASNHHPREALIQYNLACYFALRHDKDRCLSYLGIALRLGPEFVELIDDESDFDSIRDDSDFVSLVETVSRVC